MSDRRSHEPSGLEVKGSTAGATAGDDLEAARLAVAETLIEQLKPIGLSHILKSWAGFRELTLCVAKAARQKGDANVKSAQ